MIIDISSKLLKTCLSQAFKSISAHSFHAQEQIRVAKMNQAVENAMQRNIITCPPVATLQAKKKTCVVNVGAPEGSVEILDLPRKSTDEINNMVKVERLKDLLERINHQKKLLLNEIEKSEEIPGPDLEQVMKCLEKLEKEKAAIDKQPDKKNKEIEELNARERKVEEREKRLEDKIRELFKKQQEKKKIKEKEATESVTSEDASSTHPVKITIELNSPRSKKQKKTIKVVELVDQEPKKVYPRTPRKNIQENFEEELEKVQEVLKKLPEAPKKVQQQTQTTPPSEAAPRPILKKQSPIGSLKPTGKSDDSSQSVSTSYQSLPDKISPAQRDAAQKSHQKLNPVLMHYIQRLLGMGKNFGNQLSVAVSPVTTPGSSTINNSGNNESGSDGIPVFDKKRLDKLQEFINDNYSFLSEINETLERSQMNEENEENINKVDGIWKDVLRTKKPGRSEKPAEKTSKPKITVQEATKVTNRSAQLPVRPQTSKSSNRLQIPAAKLNIPPVRPQTSRGLRHQSSAQQILRQQETAVRQPSRHQEVTQQQQVTSRPSQSQPPINRPKSLSSLSQATPQAQPSIRPQISNRDMINVTKYLESHIMSNYAEYTANCQKRISDLALMMERVRQEKLKLIEHSLSSGEFGQFTEYKEIAVAGKVQDQPTTSASDLKDSRDDPASEEINNILQKQTRPFGVSKDSGISVLSRPVTSSDFRDSPDVRVTSEERENTFQPILKPPGDGTENIDEVIKEQDEKAKKQKPPPSRNRLSPTLDPHELSTIAEVETPSASKVNLIAEEFAGVESFTKFEEYARKFADRSAMFPNMMEALDCEKIASFLHPNDYGIQEISRGNVEVLPLSRASSNSSIVDVLSELRRRNLLPNDGFHENDEAHTTPTATQQVIQVPQSPKRNLPQSRIIIKTPEKFHVEIQTGTPSKRKQAKPRRDCLESPQSNDTLSGIQEIEKESRDELQLGKLGLNWATSMLKRDVQSQNLASSSSSSSVDKGNSIRIEIETNETTSSSSTAGPMNLRQFLIRELNQRSLQEKSSSDESSLSSQFMRSLLNASSKGGTSSGNTSANDRLRTSTPVMTKGSSSQFVTQKSGGTSMFPGESLSTLKGSDRGESDKSIEKQT